MTERAVFLAALEIDADQRPTYLDVACGTDLPLRQRVEKLLQAHAKAGDFLARPVLSPELPTVTPEGPQRRRSGRRLRSFRLSPEPSSMIPDGPPGSGTPGGDDDCEPEGRVGPYQVLERVGAGGMGVIYKAWHVELNRLVALKMIQTGANARAEERARFRAEAEAAARLRHPHIVQIDEVGEWQGRPYLALEFMDRGSLAPRLTGNGLPPRHAAELVELLARAVQAAHDQGIVHRDLKPTNILLATPPPAAVGTVPATPAVVALLGVPKVSDFGLAKRLDEDLGQTRTGAILGTPSYMAPEQASGKNKEVGPVADVYALGAILYECLTGRPPFRADTVLETLEQVRSQEPVSPQRLRPELPRDLVTVCLKAMAKEPGGRYVTARALADDLRRFLADEPITARPVRPWERGWRWCRRNRTVAGLGAAVLVLVLVSTLGFWVASLVGGERDLAVANFERAERAEGKANVLLKRAQDAEHEIQIRAHLAQAQAHRRSGQAGQRFQALAEIRLALAGNPSAALRQELRNEAVAALALPDLDGRQRQLPWPADGYSFDIDQTHTLYARTDRKGNCSVRRVADDSEVHWLPGQGLPALTFLSPDGRFLALASYQPGDATTFRTTLWKVDGPKALLLLPESRTRGISFNRASTQAALVGVEGTITVHDLKTGKELHRLPASPLLTREVTHALHPTEPLVAVGSYFSRVVQVRDVRTGAVVASLPHAQGANGLAWHPDGHTLAVCYTEAKQVCLYDRAGWQRSRTLETESHCTVVAFNHAGDRLAISGYSSSITLLDAGTGQRLFVTRSGLAPRCRFRRDDQWLAGNVEDGRLVIYRVGDGREHRTLTHKDPSGRQHFRCLALHPEGRLLAAGMDEGLGLWDAVTGSPLAFVPGPVATHDVLFEPSGALLTAGYAGLFRWPVRFGEGAAGREDAGALTRLSIGPPKRLLPVAMLIAQSQDGKVLAIVNRAVHGFQPHEGGWILHPGRPGPPLRIDAGKDLGGVAVSPDGRWVVTTEHAVGKAKVWDGRDGRLEKILAEWGVGWLRFSPDGRWLSTALDGDRLYEVGTWKPGPQVGGNGVFSPDSKLLAVISTGPLRLLDVTGREYATLAGPHREQVFSPTFSADGTRLVGFIPSQGVVVWDLRLLRQGLAELGLDWDQPAYRPAANPDRKVGGAPAPGRLTVTVDPRPYFSRAASLVTAALRHQQEHNFGEALKALRQAVESDATHANAHDQLAWLLVTGPPGLRDPTAALPLARRAVKLDSAEGAYQNTLGVALYRTGAFPEAVKALERSLKSSAGKADALDLFFLAMCHHRLGATGKAKECFDRGVRWVAGSEAQLPPRWREDLQAFRREAEKVLAGKQE